jgi:RimJ/RimL family protein N-acetyltransferase/SAM-dependent methyltransferase
MDDSIYFDGRHYDALWPGLQRQNELAFYRRLAKQYGEPALELGCGTGQLTLALAADGIDVMGLDLSEAMLAQARRTAAERQVGVEWRHGDCRDFMIDRQFGFVFFPANSLLHLLDWRDLQSCLAQVRAHLKPGGAFAFEIFNPSLAMLTRDPSRCYLVGTYPDPDGHGSVTVTENNVYDNAAQINHLRWYYRIEGHSEETTAQLDLRMLFPQEIEALLHYNGFDLCARYGDYDGSAFTSLSARQLIVCTPRSETGVVAESQRFTLKTDRLLLRDFEMSDFEEVYAFRSDPNVMRYFTGETETADEVSTFLRRTAEYRAQQPQTQFRFAIVLRAENRVIGGCGLDIVDMRVREGEIGYHLLTSCWGQGYATEAAQALLRFGFEDLKLHRLFADCFAANGASARVMEKAGLKYEARLRQNRLSAEGWDDTLIYSLLEDEWRSASSGKETQE